MLYMQSKLLPRPLPPHTSHANIKPKHKVVVTSKAHTTTDTYF